MSSSVASRSVFPSAFVALLAGTAIALLGGCAGMQKTSTRPPPRPAAQVAITQPPSVPAPAVVVATPAPVRTGKPKIALLLPLSGRAREIGVALQEAAELALFDGAGKDIVLVPLDTGDTPEGAVRAVERAADEGVGLLLGPLFGPSAAAAAAVAKRAGIEMLTFSNDQGVAQPGLYVLGLAVEPQVARVVEFAARRGVRRYHAMLPPTPYGGQAMAALRAAAARNGATIGREERIPASGDTAVVAQRLTDAIKGDPAGAALFVPIGPPRLSAVGQSLVDLEFDSRRARIVGTGVWDGPGAAAEKALAGAWFAAPDPARRAAFERKFAAVHDKPPPRLATLAYDAVMLSAQLARVKPGGDFTPEALTTGEGFNGVDGLYMPLADGRVERALAVLEVGPDGVKVVDPAPTSLRRPAN